jgi:hypothetical protein
VSDRLRDLLVNPDSESAGLFSDEEQNEFIFHLFTLLCVGGGMCQSEDSVNGYLHVTKTLYKARHAGHDTPFSVYSHD